jgi:transcriptional regulator with XRE-family HTH domain
MNASKTDSRAYFRALGKRIGELRKRQQYTQADLARMLGVSQQTVFSMEIGVRRVSPDKVPLLVRMFHVTMDQLLGAEPLSPVRKARVMPGELRHIERMRKLTAGDRRVVKRVTEALAVRRD